MAGVREVLIDQARRLVAELHPEASAAVLAGSVAAGRARTGSDLDLAVLLPDGQGTHRETLRHEGRGVEGSRTPAPGWTSCGPSPRPPAAGWSSSRRRPG
ncbi:nucleotidyltransferase domain-containing protein [Kitasatospora sp. NPDC057198]|uniref:nucleotidyltransferase domain-containing protein n=1 Tax=Kitasatospora sp. NPDC057198 TaxID=3346046 RepID=UPI00362A1AC4